MAAAELIMERRGEELGAEIDVTREGDDRLVAVARGVASPEEAAELLGRTALLELREPVLDSQGRIICVAPDGSEFAIEKAGMTVWNPGTGGREARCLGETGAAGIVKWKPATAVDYKGEIRALTGSFLRADGAQVQLGPTGQPSLVFEFTSEGSFLFYQITQRFQGSPGYPLAMFLDDELITAPNVNATITNGRAVIGGLTLDQAKTLSIQLNTGAIPIPFDVISAEEVSQ